MSAGFAPQATQPAGGLVARPAGNTGTGFFVSGGHIYDANGHEFVVAGFNHTTQFGDYVKNLDAINEFAKTGANSIRAVFGTFGAGGTPGKRASVVDSYLAAGLVPIVEDQSATSSQTPADLQAIVDRWLLPDNVSWLKSQEKNVILNIANEWGPNSATFRDVYISSIQRLRAAGINALIMVDAGGSGQSAATLEQYAQSILTADPQHNVAFSIHMYSIWRTEGATDVGKYGSGTFAGGPWDVKTELTKLQNLGLSMVVGEYSMYDGPTGDVPYDTRRAMEIYRSLGIGSLAWSWNQNGNHNHDMLAATAGWQYNADSDLSDFGKLVINDPTLGLKATAVPATSLRPATISGSVISNSGDATTGVAVYIDDNNNDALDAGELSITSAGNGSFTFSNLPQGVHHLRVSGAAATPVTVALPAGDSVTTSITLGDAPAIVSASGSISGVVFNDTSHDGYEGGAESGFGGKTVYLDSNRNGQFDDGEPTAVTGDSGEYKFSNLLAGTYAVGFVLPDGYEQTTRNVAVTLAAGEKVVNLAIGTMKPAALGSIAGVMFKDDNGNGVQDSGEVAEYNRGVYLDLNSNGRQDSSEPVTLTYKDGTYLFTRLAPGTYTVAKTADGTLVTTPPISVTVSALQTTQAPIMGLAELPGSISGIVFADINGDGVQDIGDLGAPGITVYADLNGNRALDAGEPTQITDALGAFGFTNLIPRQYNMRAVAPDGQVLTTGTQFFNLTSGVNYKLIKLGVGVEGGRDEPTTPVGSATASISGVYFKDLNHNGIIDTVAGGGEVGAGGVTVYLDANSNGALDSNEASQITAADGTFGFAALTAGTYHLRSVQPTGYTVITASNDVYLSDGQVFTGANIGIEPVHANADTTVYQAEEAALSGGTFKATNHADYTGSGFADYGGTGSTATFSVWRSDLGTAKLTFRYANGGTADRPLTVVVNGVTVGTIACVPTGSWDSWSTASINVALVNGTNTVAAIAGDATGGNVDSMTVATLIDSTTTGSIKGYGFRDNDGNGVQDGPDARLPGQTVFLDANANGLLDAGETSVLTHYDGAFSFTDLPAGRYRVRMVIEEGSSRTTPLGNFTLSAGQVLSGVALGAAPVVVEPEPDDVVIQAELGTFSGGTHSRNNHDDFTGSGFADFGRLGSGATWTVTRTAAGRAKLTFRYAVGSRKDRPLDIYVNGVLAGTLNFTPTGGWSTWKEVSMTVALAKGENVIKGVAASVTGGGNIDTVSIEAA